MHLSFEPPREELDREAMFDPIGEIRQLNADGSPAIILCTGKQGSGKSEMLAAIFEAIDPSFTQSLHNPAGPERHLSVKVRPMLQSIRLGKMLPGACWQLDEPRGVSNLDWWKKVSVALDNTVTGGRYMVVNIGICAIMRDDVLRKLQKKYNIWIRMLSPGNANGYLMERRINYKNPTRPEIMKPGFWGPIRDAKQPSEEFRRLYLGPDFKLPPKERKPGGIKHENFLSGLDEDIQALDFEEKKELREQKRYID